MEVILNTQLAVVLSPPSFKKFLATPPGRTKSQIFKVNSEKTVQDTNNFFFMKKHTHITY